MVILAQAGMIFMKAQDQQDVQVHTIQLTLMLQSSAVYAKTQEALEIMITQILILNMYLRR